MRLAAGLCLLLCLMPVHAVTPAGKPVAVQPAAAAPAGRPATVRFVVKAPQEAQLSSQMPGKLLRLPVAEGAAFRRGDRLAEFDCEERRAQLEKTRAALVRAEKSEASQKQLRELKAISDLDHEIALADLREAQADVAMAQAQVNQCVINAPYAGRVVRNLANPHEHMAAGTPLIQIVESGTLKLEMLVPSQWLRWLKPGAGFSVVVEELNLRSSARVKGLGARVDAASQTIDMRAEFTAPVPGVLPGMSGIADFGVR